MDSMTEGTTDESDGLDDAEFLGEHEKYLEDCEKQTLDLLNAEEERQNVRIIWGGIFVLMCSEFAR
jgi:hypothetical protein